MKPFAPRCRFEPWAGGEWARGPALALRFLPMTWHEPTWRSMLSSPLWGVPGLDLISPTPSGDQGRQKQSVCHTG